MTDRPIPFSAPMVRALRRAVNPKTQTRRIVSAHNSTIDGTTFRGSLAWDQLDWDRAEPRDTTLLGEFVAGKAGAPLDHHLRVPHKHEGSFHRVRPKWDVGDRLWAREAYRFGAEWDDTKPSEVVPSGLDGGDVYYEADGLMKNPADNGWGKLRPGMFMPRWASRITLELVSVRAERLQDISEADAIAEGWEKQPERSADPIVHRDAARDWYADLWDSINGPGSWAKNPYVWRLEFTRC